MPGSRARDVSREIWGNGSLAAGGLQHLISQPQFSYLQNGFERSQSLNRDLERQPAGHSGLLGVWQSVRPVPVPQQNVPKTSVLFKGLSQPFGSLKGTGIGRSRWRLTRG